MKILGISGKRSAGKSTAANFLSAVFLANICDEEGNQLLDYARIDDATGQILVPQDEEHENVLNLYSSKPEAQEWLEENLFHFIRTICFADEVKEFCALAYNMERDWLWGGEKERNYETPLTYSALAIKKLPKGAKKTDYITYREMIKYVAKKHKDLYGDDYWVDLAFEKINTCNSQRVVIADVRYPNQVQRILDRGGYVVRLTRKSDGDDDSVSETALDGYEGFSHVIDNQNMSIRESNEALFKYCEEIGFFNLG
jgi:hypothetical protein